MAQQYKCVIFDVDGTLLDTSEGMLSAVRYTIQKFGLEPLDEATIKSFIGPPIQHSFQRIYGFPDPVIAEMASVFRDRYKDKDLLLAKAYDGIFDVLDYLRRSGIAIAIATYKREDYAARLLNAFGFDRYTALIFGSDFEGKLRKKDIIELALKEAGITDHSQALMVGDSDNDAIGAAEIGTDFLGVTYGFGFKTKSDVEAFQSIGTADTPTKITEIISRRELCK